MKINYRILGLILAVVGFSSCKDFLDLAPISQIGDNEFYSNTEEVEAGVIAIYDGLQQGVLREFALTEMRSDNTRTKSSEGEWAQFETLDVQATNGVVANYWSTWYNVIFRANTVLQHLDAVDDATLKAQFEGEAKFARALAHFKLVRLFGDIPLVDRVVYIEDEEYYSRKPSDQVYAFIIQDLEDAISKLPTRSGIAEGRATKGAAQSLLAKVHLTLGNYSEARTLLEAVMNSGDYALVPNYRDVFYDELNEEIIFAIQYIEDNAEESQDFSLEFTALGRASGLNYITDNFKNSVDPADSIRAAVLYNPDNPAEVGKFIASSSDATLAGNDWIVLRYADVLLMHAEAILAGKESTNDAAALASFNAVRARAGLPEVTELTKDMLLHERRVELAFENQRWFDLIRFGVAEQVLSAFAAEEGFTFQSTDLLLPIPQREINVSKGLLTQNPGY